MKKDDKKRTLTGIVGAHRRRGMLMAGALTGGLYLDKVIFSGGRVSGDLMEPLLSAGDLVLADRRAFNKEAPKRGDILIYKKRPESAPGTGIKRLMAFPGERVEVRDGAVYIDGTQLDETFRMEFLKYEDEEAAPVTPRLMDMAEVMVPDNCVFVLGDNRDPSAQETDLSGRFVRWDDVIGKVLFRVWPPAKAGRVR